MKLSAVTTLILAGTLLTGGCANIMGFQGAPDAAANDENAGSMSVRKVTTPSDVARIRPDYQIVLSGDEENLTRTHRAVKWEVKISARSLAPVVTRTVEEVNAKPEPKRRQVVESILLDETHFEFGSARLSKIAMTALDHTLMEIQKLGPNKLSILGHTDSIGSRPANQTLSEHRVEAVFAYLKSKGLGTNEVERTGFADTAPSGDNKTAAGRAKNRRTEILATVVKPVP